MNFRALSSQRILYDQVNFAGKFAGKFAEYAIEVILIDVSLVTSGKEPAFFTVTETTDRKGFNRQLNCPLRSISLDSQL